MSYFGSGVFKLVCPLHEAFLEFSIVVLRYRVLLDHSRGDRRGDPFFFDDRAIWSHRFRARITVHTGELKGGKMAQG